MTMTQYCYSPDCLCTVDSIQTYMWTLESLLTKQTKTICTSYFSMFDCWMERLVYTFSLFKCFRFCNARFLLLNHPTSHCPCTSPNILHPFYLTITSLPIISTLATHTLTQPNLITNLIINGMIMIFGSFILVRIEGFTFVLSNYAIIMTSIMALHV